MRHITLAIALLVTTVCFAQTDTTKLNKLQEQVTTLTNKVDEVKRDQNNYTIEKDLLKETYSNNFDRINLVLTALLGIFAVLTFFGIRDINSIKKEYKEELEKFRKLQLEIEAKSKEFDLSKKKYDEEITLILKQNEEQNKKIKILEIKDKIASLFKEKQYGSALEFCAVALEISPDDKALQFEKGKILGKLNRLGEAIEAYEKLLSVDNTHSGTIINVTELYLFLNQTEKADALIKTYPNYFKEGRELNLLDFFELIKKYHHNDIAGMKEYAKTVIDKQNPATQKKYAGWDFSDALTFSYYEPESEKKDVLRKILFYLNGNVKGTDLDKGLQLNMFPPQQQ